MTLFKQQLIQGCLNKLLTGKNNLFINIDETNIKYKLVATYGYNFIKNEKLSISNDLSH